MDKTLKYLQNLLKPNDIVVVAISTGPDSMFLLYQLLKFKEKYNLQIIVAHVNHHLRDQSDEEEKFIKQFSKENNLICECLQIKKYSKDNFHNEARNKRYEFFYQLVQKYHAHYLMTAHHGDDLIETILMRLTRGSSLNGYAGIKQMTPMGDFKIIRPLLYMTKEEITNYLDKQKLPYYIDSSNASSKYTRNRYRQNILPFLKKENKDVHLKYLEFSQEIEEANEFIDKQVQAKIKQVYKNNQLDINELNNIDDFLLRKIIGEIFHILYGQKLQKINRKHIAELFMLIKTNKASMAINLPANIQAVKEYNIIKFIDNIDSEEKEYRFIFKDKIILPNGNQIIKVDKSAKTDNYHLYLNSKEIKLPLLIRTKKPQDKMIVKNLNGTKKIQDIFTNEKIAKSQREAYPIVTDSADNILWLPGLKKSKFDKAKTKNYDIILKYLLKEGKNNE